MEVSEKERVVAEAVEELLRLTRLSTKGFYAKRFREIALTLTDSGYRRGIEDAAKIAEDEADSYRQESELCSIGERPIYEGKAINLDGVAAAIRALGKEGNDGKG